ncbi:uncharacterized protein EI90DRAFT_3067984 [Cantharellus anzutake]|uniref:uncharacterized protein n=1 Tax=Cantharellus anzutake TaxID=1750568 RepID=UPI0019037103|nr:uncharacterized protein EI90DRAFT_3067984 [Cantharellus anzutake]KAF8327130.1 hypothetical protein EI90DRAFT_3067984 [Cantharellus anzutake]
MILFSKNPFPLLTNDTQLWRALESGLSPWNWEQSSPVEKILSNCCVGPPDARPVMREVFRWLMDACVEPDSSPILEVSDPEANRPLALPPTDSSVNPFLMPDGDPASSNAVTPSKETTTKVDEQVVPVALSPEAHNTIPMLKQAKLLLPKATPGPREVKELTVEPPSNTAQQSSQARNHTHHDQHGDSAGSRLGPPGTTRTSRFPSPGPSDLKRQVSPELVTALPRSRLERERHERLRAEEELRRKEAEARRKLAEKDVELDRLEAAPADPLTQIAIPATVAATAPKKPSANDSDEQGRNITSYDDEGGGSSEDEEDPTTDEHVRIPYRPKKLMHARKRNRKVHFVTTHTTAGGMSTPPSSFSVLAPAEEAQRRRDEAIRDRLATLERLEQREKAEREAQERERAATLKSVNQNLSIVREQPSVSDITARLPAAPRIPYLSLPILPVRLDTAPKKASTNDSNERCNVTSYDDEGGGSSEDEEDPSTDEHVRIPYRPKKLMHARKRNRKVHFVTTHTTAGGMSTPLSSFSVLAPAEEAQRRRDEAIRDRLATLERLEQREKAEREAQERERAATLKSVRQNVSIAREQPSVSDITARIRNSLEQAQPAAPQMPHPSLPILPVRLDRGPPENSPFVPPQASLSSEASGQTVRENVRRIEQDPSKPPKPHPHSVHSMTTHTTAGGTSTPLSSFSVLAPTEEAQRRRGEAIRDRLATLERLEQREKAEREAQERERAATLKSVRQSLSIAREQPSVSDITARIRNSSEQAQPGPRIPHPSLPIFPVRLDRGPPENSPFMHPQANHPSEASGQTVWENVRRIEQVSSNFPTASPNPHSVHSVTTHTTAGGMSTPLSSFSVLAPAEEGQRRRNEAIQDRLATLERLEQREGAEREAQESERAATLKSVSQNLSIAREQPSVSDITAHIRNSSEQAQPAAPRMLHPSLPILPVRLDTVPKPSTNDSNEQGRNVTSYDDEGGGSSEDEEDSTTDEHVRIPYRPEKLMRARKRNRKGSMHSVTTHTTAGGMSTPLSSFSVLAPAEEAQRRRDEAIRDRLATLERLEQREKAEREAQEREWAATVKRNFSITRDQPSASDITAPL